MVRKALKKVGNILSVIAIAFEVILILIIVVMKLSGQMPSLFGYNMCVIATPSMEPKLMVGDIIISELYENGDAIRIGDIVTYCGSEGELNGKLITHEIIDIIYGDDGKTDHIITKGSANYEADPPVELSAVVSVMKYRTFVLGPVYKLVNTTLGFLLIVEIPILTLIVDEIVGIVKAVKKEGNEIEDEEDHI